MLVVHPQDNSTDFLAEIYAGMDNVVRFDGIADLDLDRLLQESSHDKELTMFMGHGTPFGLRNITWGENDSPYYIGGKQAGMLLGRKKLFGMWCNANEFAQSYGLNGLWSGMIISDVFEAAFMGFKASEEEIEEENLKLARRVRYCLDNYPLPEIPARIKEMDDRKSEVTRYNYSSWYFY